MRSPRQTFGMMERIFANITHNAHF